MESNVYLVWLGSRTLIGEMDEDARNTYIETHKCCLSEVLEAKSFIVNTPQGIKEIVQLIPVIPLGKGTLELSDIKPDLVIEVAKENDIYKMYLEMRSGLTITDKVPNIKVVK